MGAGGVSTCHMPTLKKKMKKLETELESDQKREKLEAAMKKIESSLTKNLKTWDCNEKRKFDSEQTWKTWGCNEKTWVWAWTKTWKNLRLQGSNKIWKNLRLQPIGLETPNQETRTSVINKGCGCKMPQQQNWDRLSVPAETCCL